MKKRPERKKEGHGKAAVFIAVTMALLPAVAVGALVALDALRAIWREQCIVTDREVDVVITSGRMVHPDVITYHFGLTNGVNLATVPFEELRNRLLEQVPNIRDIRIERRLPNRVTIDVFEREPIARIAGPDGKKSNGRVADSHGIVFEFMNNTAQLPLVHEPATPPTKPGKRLTGAAAAALRLIEAANSPDLAELRVLEIETFHPDYLMLTLGDYSRAKFAWSHMLEDSLVAKESLDRQLRNLANAIASQVMPTKMWIATDFDTPSHIYAQDPNRAN